ncbi:aspartate/glutamate racemase family protein [Skermanella mucosa]|uniref:aspartate/glutamate racemase family protein n=1 Tax=Skermanella mucosa TaxID=1789672 RepID=UPI00192B7452|nr:aspartate/glutamate racemase family protein [Skermanella mucosa]UEM19848.1 aspartate/glutamate racemase family protein [Skermanella mucosa]
MRIKVINPNTTAGMTAKIGEAARAIAAPGTEIVAVNPAAGPVSIEGHYDEAVSVLGVLEEVRKGEAEGCDGYVIACFGDPGLLAAREVATGPVVGIAEAAMHAASFISTGFSIVTTLTRTCVIAEHLVERYGMHHACRKVRGTDIPVLDLEGTGEGAGDGGGPVFRAIVAECRRAAAEDRCGAIVLGCAGMADLVARVQREVGLPVIDGVAAAVVQVEGLVRLGLGTSKHGDLAWPLPKTYTGELARFAPAGK